MTLSTNVGFRGDVDARDLHAWINAYLLDAPDAIFDDEGPDRWSQWPRLVNTLGQGLSAWLTVTHNNGEELVYLPEDTTGWDRDDIDYHASFPTGMTAVADFDTAYGYTGPNGESCGMLHAAFIAVLIARYAEPRGLSVVWQNEFTGTWHEGMDGLEELAGHAVDAKSWLESVVRPAIEGSLK